jgi:ribosomal protein S12 methylthiotransferase accessory factor
MEMNVEFPGGMRVDAVFGDHRLETDQKATAGGEGAAPSPFDLFLASIATCTGYYILAFCRKREIAIKGLELTMRTERDADTKRVTLIDMRVRLPEGFPERYTDACLRSAEQCTVKRHLETPPRIVIGLAGEAGARDTS